MKPGATQSQGPSPSERLLFDVWDRVDAARLRGGEQEATKLAKRAYAALNGDITMHNLSKAAKPGVALAQLQALRDQAENDGDLDAADAYSEAIRSVVTASSGGTPTPAAPPMDAGADDTALSTNDDEAPDALALGKAIRKGQAAFLNQYKQQNADDIRKRPLALADSFAQGQPRANPAAPMAPPVDAQKLAKAKAELEEAQVRNQILGVYRNGPIK